MRSLNREQAEVLNLAWFFCDVRLELGAPIGRFVGCSKRVSLDYGGACELEELPQVVVVSCAVALFPATTTRERVRFNIINPQTGNQVRCDCAAKRAS